MLKFTVDLGEGSEPSVFECERALLVVADPNEDGKGYHVEIWQSHPEHPGFMITAIRLLAKAMRETNKTQFDLLGRVVQAALDHGVTELQTMVNLAESFDKPKEQKPE